MCHSVGDADNEGGVHMCKQRVRGTLLLLPLNSLTKLNYSLTIFKNKQKQQNNTLLVFI